MLHTRSPEDLGDNMHDPDHPERDASEKVPVVNREKPASHDASPTRIERVAIESGAETHASESQSASEMDPMKCEVSEARRETWSANAEIPNAVPKSAVERCAIEGSAGIQSTSCIPPDEPDEEVFPELTDYMENLN